MTKPEERIALATAEINAVLKKHDCSQVLSMTSPGGAKRIEDGGWVLSVPTYELAVIPNDA